MSNLKNSSGTTDQWMIKSSAEQVKGPYSTDAISKMIIEGIFSGQEEISAYPDGDWLPLSKQSEFYESLMESLENPVERDEKNAVKMDAETVIRIIPKPETEAPEPVNEIKSVADLENIFALIPEIQKTNRPGQPAVNGGAGLIRARDEPLTIELQQIKKLQAKELKKLLGN